MTSILIVEDDANLRFVLRIVLENGGYEVREAPNGVAALERIVDRPPDLVVADIRMPPMGGRELVSRLRSNPSTVRMPVVLLSGYPEVEQVAGATAILAKPFEAVDLLKMVSSLVGNS